MKGSPLATGQERSSIAQMICVDRLFPSVEQRWSTVIIKPGGGANTVPSNVSKMTTNMRKIGFSTGMVFSIISIACPTDPPIAGALIQAGNGSFLYAQIFGVTAVFFGIVVSYCWLGSFNTNQIRKDMAFVISGRYVGIVQYQSVIVCYQVRIFLPQLFRSGLTSNAKLMFIGAINVGEVQVQQALILFSLHSPFLANVNSSGPLRKSGTATHSQIFQYLHKWTFAFHCLFIR